MPAPPSDPGRSPRPPRQTTAGQQSADLLAAKRKQERALRGSSTTGSAASNLINEVTLTDTTSDPTTSLTGDLVLPSNGLWVGFVEDASAVFPDPEDPLAMVLNRDATLIARVYLPGWDGSADRVPIPPISFKVKVTTAPATTSFELSPGGAAWDTPRLAITAYRLPGDLST